MIGKLKDAPEKDGSEEVGCKHFWMIETADGPTSMGTCKYCGEEKEFLNWMPDILAAKKPKNRDFELSDVIGAKPGEVPQGVESEEEDAGITV